MAITKTELKAIKKKLPRGAYVRISDTTKIPYTRIQSYFNNKGNQSEYEVMILEEARKIIAEVEQQKKNVKTAVESILR